MEKVDRIIEIQGRFDGLWDVTVRWRWEDGTADRELYAHLTGHELITLLDAFADRYADFEPFV